MATYLNLLIDPLETRIDQDWVRAANTNFLYKHVLARTVHLGLAPASVIVCALDIIVGLGSGAAAVATLGRDSNGRNDNTISVFAGWYLHSSNALLSHPYKNLLKAINPAARIVEPGLGETAGIVTPYVRLALINLAVSFGNSDNLLKKHLVSRLTYMLTAVALVVARVADAIMGLFYAAASLVLLGLHEPLNSMAFRGLQAPGVVNDLFVCLMRTINPQINVIY